MINSINKSFYGKVVLRCPIIIVEEIFVKNTTEMLSDKYIRTLHVIANFVDWYLAA